MKNRVLWKVIALAFYVFIFGPTALAQQSKPQHAKAEAGRQWQTGYELRLASTHISKLTSVEFTSCADGKESLLIKTIKVIPNPPLVGKDLKIETIGRLRKNIDPGAKGNLKAYLGITKVTDKDLDLCKDLKLSCPVKADPEKDQLITFILPVTGTPAGVTIKVRLEAINIDGSPLFCMQGTLKFAEKK